VGDLVFSASEFCILIGCLTPRAPLSTRLTPVPTPGASVGMSERAGGSRRTPFGQSVLCVA
jgi:hypothetical protein